MQEKTRQKIFAKVDQELETGRLWRAKEILSSNIACQPYDTALYERYGQILDQTGNLVDAGKYYFLSGVRIPAYEAGIRIFLQRYTKNQLNYLIGQFPNAAKRARIDDYPEPIASELKAITFPQKPHPQRGQKKVLKIPAESLGRQEYLIAFCALFFVVAAGIGTFVTIRWMIHWLYKLIT